MESLTPIEQSRNEKRITLEHAGIVCYPERFERDATTSTVRERVEQLVPTQLINIEKDSTQKVAIA